MKNKIAKIRTIFPIAFFFALFFVLFFYSFVYQVSADTNDEMLGYWKFDGNADDSSGHNNNGTPMGGPSYPSTMSGMFFPNTQSINFGGTSSYVYVPGGTGVQPTSRVTFSTWVYLDAMPGSDTTIGGNYNPGDPNVGYQFIIGPTQVSFRIGNANVSYPTTLPVATWFHLAATWDGTVIKLFLNSTNGIPTNSAPFTGSINYSSTSFRLGNFQGKLDDVRLYKRALSGSPEISDLAAKKHTSAIWQGTFSNDYSEYPNWNITSVPDPFTLVTIASSTTAPVFTQDEGMAGLTIQTGASLDIGQQNLTMNDNAVFVNYGNFILTNLTTQVLNGFVNDANSGTVTLKLTNSVPVTGLKAGSSYNNLVIDSRDGPPHELILNNNFIANGNLHIQTGTLTASSNMITVKGNFSTSATNANFIPGNSTVILTGNNQTILGSNTFWNLQKSTGTGATLYFDIGKTQTILNSLSLQGASGFPLNLHSTTDGTQWNIDSQGTETFSFLNVKDSNNTSGTPLIVAGNSIINSGNNTNWIFDTGAPAINLDTIASPNPDNTPVFTGSSTDLYSIVYSVQYQVDSYIGAWIPCQPLDGTFDQLTETFSCAPATAMTDGAHTVYFRSLDYHGNTTSLGSYPTKSITIDTVAPVRSSGSPSGTLNAGTTSTVLTLMTNETANCSYSETAGTSIGSMTAFSSTGNTGHSTTITGLQNGIDKNYYVRCMDLLDHYNLDDYTISFSVDADSGGSGDGSGSTDIAVHIKSPTSDQVITDKEFTFKADTNNTDSVKFYYKKSGSDEKIYLGEDDTDDGGLFTLKVNIEDEFDNGDYTLVAKAIDGNDDKSDEMKFSVKLTYAETQSSSTTTASSPVEETASTAADTPTSTSPASSSYPTTPATASQPTAPVDSDGDGIIDSLELQLGTDPNSSDSDGDGKTDEEEILEGTDPEKSGTSGSDKVNFDDAKEKGDVDEKNKVNNVEMLEKNGKKTLKFSGKSVPNSYVTLYVYSDDPIVVRVKTDANGNWNYEMDENLEDGEHEVYVALTDSQGKIKSKSSPLRFVKTAEAISVIPFAEAAPSKQSPVEKLKGNFVYSLIAISIIFIIIAIIVLSFVAKRKEKEEERANIQPTVSG